MDAITANLLSHFYSLAPNVQIVVLCVLGIIAVASHIAPYTATKKDDFLIEKKNTFWGLFKSLFAIVAGNYRQAKNHTKAMEEKAAIKAKR